MFNFTFRINIYVGLANKIISSALTITKMDRYSKKDGTKELLCWILIKMRTDLFWARNLKNTTRRKMIGKKDSKKDEGKYDKCSYSDKHCN